MTVYSTCSKEHFQPLCLRKFKSWYSILPWAKSVACRSTNNTTICRQINELILFYEKSQESFAFPMQTEFSMDGKSFHQSTVNCSLSYCQFFFSLFPTFLPLFHNCERSFSSTKNSTHHSFLYLLLIHKSNILFYHCHFSFLLLFHSHKTGYASLCDWKLLMWYTFLCTTRLHRFPSLPSFFSIDFFDRENFSFELCSCSNESSSLSQRLLWTVIWKNSLYKSFFPRWSKLQLGLFQLNHLG